MKCVDCGGFSKGRSNNILKKGWPILCQRCGVRRVFASKEPSGTYSAVHIWVKTKYGKPDHCDRCGRKKKKSDGKNKFEWSNKDGRYSRDISTWWQLCKPCHAHYDIYILGGKKRKHGEIAKYLREGCRCLKCRKGYSSTRKKWPSNKNRNRARSLRRAAARAASERIKGKKV